MRRVVNEGCRPGITAPGGKLGRRSLTAAHLLRGRITRFHIQTTAFSFGAIVMANTSWFSKMTGTAMTLDNLGNVLTLQLQDLYSAEDQLISALPKMASAAHSPELRSALSSHLAETQRQKTRLEQAFRLLNQRPESDSCEAMQGLIAEGEEIIGLDGDPEVKDAALIAAAQRVEHYEIAGYGCARCSRGGWDMPTSRSCFSRRWTRNPRPIRSSRNWQRVPLIRRPHVSPDSLPPCIIDSSL